MFQTGWSVSGPCCEKIGPQTTCLSNLSRTE
jgi:hypothetical protein